ncbi:MAG: Arc family DNA binding domain-containing protein [Dehalococcoidia bacterium]
MRRVFVPLPADAVDALIRVAERELRAPQDQAAWIVLDALRRAGELPAAATAEVVAR